MHELNIVTVVQARVGSTRLPRKVLLPLAGKPLLARMIERVKRATLTGTVVVATTTDWEDDAVAHLCWKEGIAYYRGDPDDLLDRHYRAGKFYGADVVVKIPSDCPLIDPEIIDRVIGAYTREADTYDYVSNLHPPTYPDGNDVAVIRMSALEVAWREAWQDFEREHTTPYFWENGDRFRLLNVRWESGRNLSMSHRWTIDYEADYQFIRSVYDALYPNNPEFGLHDILDLLDERPDISALNRNLAGVNWYRHHLANLKSIGCDVTRWASV